MVSKYIFFIVGYGLRLGPRLCFVFLLGIRRFEVARLLVLAAGRRLVRDGARGLRFPSPLILLRKF